MPSAVRSFLRKALSKPSSGAISALATASASLLGLVSDPI
jgi:hypothetical protein